ncbi:MAG: hypothetical protein WEB33_03200 [Bacteroidota bacterium]
MRQKIKAMTFSFCHEKIADNIAKIVTIPDHSAKLMTKWRKPLNVAVWPINTVTYYNIITYRVMTFSDGSGMRIGVMK